MNIEFTKEQIAKAAEAKSAEELAELAKEYGIRLSPKQAEQFFAELHREGELDDDELDAVAGGKDDEDAEPKTRHALHKRSSDAEKY